MRLAPNVESFTRFGSFETGTTGWQEADRRRHHHPLAPQIRGIMRPESDWVKFRRKFTPQRPTRFDLGGCLSSLILVGFGIVLATFCS
jgi:hypothetical protein